MAKRAQAAAGSESFEAARTMFEEVVGWAGDPAKAPDHATFEEELEARLRELGRRMYQGRLDVLFHAEGERLARRPPPGKVIRVRSRQLESIFGRVNVRRRGLTKRGGQAAHFPMDERLKLPAELYSLGLRKRVAEEVRRQSWDEACASIDRATGGHVPKRQAEELARRAAQDFETFYREREPNVGNDVVTENALLVMSSDGKGIAMRPEALRDATQKAAAEEQAASDAVRGDPTATRRERRHQKRMATVTAVWDQEPVARQPRDILSKLRKKAGPPATELPRPRNKTLAATVIKPLSEAVHDMFDEADRRDPQRKRETVVLVDGNEHQIAAIQAEAKKRGRTITIVLDLLHALHYLWLAGMAVRGGDAKKTDRWVTGYLEKLLTAAHPTDVLAGIRQAATLAGLDDLQRKPVDDCIAYLSKNLLHIAYGNYLAAGFPIATGVIEGACRHLVQDRLGITGARWGLASAEAVLRLRALWSNGDWDAYWRFHRRKEHERRNALKHAA